MIRNIFSILTLAVLFTFNSFGIKRPLDKSWNFKRVCETEWHGATVPGTVHTDLMELGLIPDPFIGENEKDVQWVDKEDWVYQTTFNLSKEEFKENHISLIFEGLDTYADVWLNDSLILQSDNMFRRYELPVKNIIREDDNQLTILLHSPIKTDLPKYESLPYHLYAGNDQSERGGLGEKQVSIFARKAPYQYGWDWGPRLVTSGIWRPVFLEAWSGLKIEDVHISTDNIGSQQALMKAELEINADEAGKYNLEIKEIENNNYIISKYIDLKPGINRITIPFEIKEPKLWWTSGLGDPYLYDFNITLKKGKTILASEDKKAGIRKIELVREPDENGTSFYFRLNGKPVFMKGTNYIPQDSFLPRVSKERYKRLLESVKAANMNMVRVWGGGIYEDDYFYELCDSLGIAVWQDFMFACSLYPGDEEFLDNVRAEAIDNVKRLRSHPSLALWCGNNEILEAWQYWGFREDYEEDGVDEEIWKGYEKLFHEVLPEVVEELSPEISYWPSSPSNGKEESRDPMNGDSHIWNVWGWNEPIDRYNELNGRFVSEYGFQSFPEMKTIKTFSTDSSSYRIESEPMMHRQRAGSVANARLMNYLTERYDQPKDFESFATLSQLLQADAMKIAIESHRRNKPLCMGTLMWQLDDCWPGISWSTIDYFGNWKAAHYQAKRSMADIGVFGMVSNDSISVNLVSDSPEDKKGLLLVEIYGMEGNKLGEYMKNFNLKADAVEKITLPKNEISPLLTEDEFIVGLYFIEDAGKEYRNSVLSQYPKRLGLQNPEIDLKVEKEGENYSVKIKSDKYVKGLQLNLPFEEYFFEDNFIDLLPGKEYEIGLVTSHPLEEIVNNISFVSYVDLIKNP